MRACEIPGSIDFGPALERFDLKGRGPMVVVKNPADFESGECPYVGRIGLIDGDPYLICGVDSFLLNYTIDAGEKIGLLVERLKI